MGSVTNIDDARPHCTTTVECKQCGYKWVAVYPECTKALECPGCHDAVNEYGTRVYVNRCRDCGAEFTVCPIPDNTEDWQHCMSEDCASYDETRDGDKLFEQGRVKRDDDDA